MKMEKLIDVKNLFYKIPLGEIVLDKVSFTLSTGEFMGVLGRNGIGKTTLLDILLGLRSSAKGQIEILGEDPRDRYRHNKDQICYISQDIQLRKDISVKEFLDFYSKFYKNYSQEKESYLVEFFSIKPEVLIGTLSTGQQKKIQIIAALSAQPKILLVDELTAVLDPEARHIFFKVIHELKTKENLAILLATNITEDLNKRADRILYIENKEAQIVSPLEIESLFSRRFSV